MAALDEPTKYFWPFRIMTWNVLASVHTHHNFRDHGGAEGETETAIQRDARHRRIVRRIQWEGPDVVLLQEADEAFLPRAWRAGPLPCGEALFGYTTHRSYGATGGTHEGVAVLLRDGVWARDPRLPKVAVPRSAATGWKNGIMLHAVRCADPTQVVCFCSVHLRWGADDGPKCGLLAATLEQAAAGVPVVLGGDFNTEPRALAVLESCLARCGGGLRRLPSDPGRSTVQDRGDRVSVIDHLYASPALGLPPVMAGEAGGRASCEVGPAARPWADDGDGSDHAWLLAALGSAHAGSMPPPL
jgi:hypothetical protein